MSFVQCFNSGWFESISLKCHLIQQHYKLILRIVGFSAVVHGIQLLLNSITFDMSQCVLVATDFG